MICENWKISVISALPSTHKRSALIFLHVKELATNKGLIQETHKPTDLDYAAPPSSDFPLFQIFLS